MKKNTFYHLYCQTILVKKNDLEDIIVIFKKYAIEIVEKARYQSFRTNRDFFTFSVYI